MCSQPDGAAQMDMICAVVQTYQTWMAIGESSRLIGTHAGLLGAP